ncbi:MAG: Hint domain-containing protein, partial [bacterium]
MASEFTFLRIYKSLARQTAQDEDVMNLYWSLQDSLALSSVFCKSCNKTHYLQDKFEKMVPERLDALLAIDAIAHAIHQGGEEVLQKIFPGADYSIFKSALDELAGLEKENEIRKFNRGYFTTLLSEDGIVMLEKQDTQVGMTTKEDILPAIQEYEKLYKAGFASPAEILTLSRFYPDNPHYRKAVEQGKLYEEENEPMVVGGPASIEAVDREGHLITVGALDKAFDQFMKNMRIRPLNILHSDVQIGWALPIHITKNGRIYKSGVDDKQLWLLAEIRNDTKIANRVRDEIEKGNLRSYSIAGSATNTSQMQKGANKFMQVNALELAEVTICIVPWTKIWTQKGLKEIKDVTTDDVVYTHKNKWQSVLQVMSREVHENLIKIVIENDKEIILTGNHPIRTITGHGYQWVDAKDLKVGNCVSSHFQTGNCFHCGAPLFKTLGNVKRNFCGKKCFYASGATQEEKQMRSINRKEQCKDLEFVERVCRKGGLAVWNNKNNEEKEKESYRLRTMNIKPRMIAHCLYCGSEIVKIINGSGRNSRRKYCSRHCSGKDLQRATQTDSAKVNRALAMQAFFKSEGASEKRSAISKKMWDNRTDEEKAEILHKSLLGSQQKTRPEKQLETLLGKLYPNIWQYTGRHSDFSIGGKYFPDFWNGENKLIEL